MICKRLFLLCFLFSVFNVRVISQENFIDYEDRYNKRNYTVRENDFNFVYEAITDTESVYVKNWSDAGVKIKKDEKFSVKGDLIHRMMKDIFFIPYENDCLAVNMKDFALVGKQKLPSELVNNSWVMAYDYDVLYSKNRNMLQKYEWWVNIYDDKLSNYFYIDNDGESASYKNWFQLINNPPHIVITNSCVFIYGFFSNYEAHGYVVDIFDDKIKVLWEYAGYRDCFIDAFDSLKTGYESIIEYELDGDYIILKIDGYDCLLAKKCLNFDTEWTNLIANNKCIMNNITFPRHADGTCDYEDVSSVKTVSSPTTNVTPNKTMHVTENLKLRSGEATTSEVLTVMQAGTKVKILELGKAENIDGINSNWVKVEVQSGAKDRDGRTIRAGTVGWCYGGYLK